MKRTVLLLLMITLILTGCVPPSKADPLKERRDGSSKVVQETREEEKKQGEKVPLPKSPPPKNAILFFVGDIIYHPPLYRGLPWERDPASLNIHYERLKPWIEKSDFALGNFEGSMNPKGSVRGFPLFQVPHGTVASLKEAGFDAMTTANNHCLDGGEAGLDFLIQKMDEVGMKHFGTFLSPESTGLIEEIKGIKVGFLGYTEMFNGMEGSIPAERRYKVRSLDFEKISRDIQKMKEQCDFLFVLPHWGEEYTKAPVPRVREYANRLLDLGADGVIASHPHVVHSVERREDGKLIAFSLGNSLANQRREYMGGDPRPEGGLGLYIHLREEPGKSPEIVMVEYLPTFVERRAEGGQYAYRVMACRDGFDQGAFASELTKAEQSRARELESLVLQNSMGLEKK